ncbi:MAG: SBBP repeat-containing protein [Verrucomicrobiota bacterium]
MNRCVKKILSAGFATTVVALAVSAQTTPLSGGMSLFFEANHGQADSSAQFLARGRDFQFLISPTRAQMVLRKADGLAKVQIQFAGANVQAQIRGDAELSGKINYLTGNDPAQWHTGVPTFAKVRVEEIYPGIGLVYYGNQQQLEYDLTVAPGANPGTIKIRFDGVDKIAVNTQGELVLTLPDGEIRQPEPVIYQMAGGTRCEISGGYRLVDAHTVAFAVGSYDYSLPLVIDPILSYSTYFGGKYGDTAWSVKVDTNGYIYVAGATFSPQFLTNTPGAYQTNSGGTLTGDAFVAKFDNFGTNLIYFTYLGGNADDSAVDLVVDGAGHAYITGFTDSTNFPTKNALYPKIGGTNIVFLGQSYGYYGDAFVTELETNGSQLVYSTYLGGSLLDSGRGIAVDSAGYAYITGRTCSTNFPTKNAYQPHLACTNSVFFGNAFVTIISPGGSNLVYSSYFGGNNYDSSGGIAVDPAGCVYITGATASTNFPTKNALFQYLNGYPNGSPSQTFTFDAFVAKFQPFCTGLVYSTYLGSTNYDVASRITCDSAGNAYVVGSTASPLFTNTVSTNVIINHLTNNLNGSFPVTTNVFLTEINSNGSTILNSAVFGGNAMDLGYGVAIDTNTGNIFVVGTTTSTNFPTYNVPSFLRSTNSGKSDAFVIAFNTNASTLLYSTYLGGNNNDFGYGIALDTNDNAYVVGQTLSTNFPTLNARQTTRNGTNDAFLAKILLTVPSPVLTITNNGNNNFMISWPAVLPFEAELGQLFILEFNPSLASSTNWNPADVPVVLTNDLYTYSFHPAPIYTNAFFRLHAP